MCTIGPDGSDIRVVAKHGNISHFDWRDEKRILVYCGPDFRSSRYRLVEDGPGNDTEFAPDVLPLDGHMTWSRSREWILTDEYPGEDGKRPLLLYHPDTNRRIEIGRYFSPPFATGEIRCDLHPCWNRDDSQVCFDSAHDEGLRQIYIVDVSSLTAGG